MRLRFSDVHAAWQLNRAPLLRLLSVQARLISRQTPLEIASKTGIEPAVIESYSALFYGFEHAYPHADAWIRCSLIKTDLLPGLSTSLRSVVLHLSLYGGALIADDLIGAITRVGIPLNVGKLVRGEAPFLPKDWSIVRALAVNLTPLSQQSALVLMKENLRLRLVRRPNGNDSILASTRMAMKWADEMPFARLVKPHVETAIATLSQSAAA